MGLNIIQVDRQLADTLAPLVADFRATLRAYKRIEAQPDLEAGREEILEFLEAGYPVFAAEDAGDLAGYIVCRTDDSCPCLWVEHLYVRHKYRRKGVATLLFEKAEEIAASRGEDTVYNYVHPNNDGMIQFLRAKGYTVLNLIEIRKPYKGEKLSTTIDVNQNTFDY